MIAIAALGLALSLADTTPRAECVLPEGPILARARLGDGRDVVVTPGALHIGDRVFTRCDDLPRAHPSAVAVWGDAVAVGFRQGGVAVWRGDRFEAITGLPEAPVRALAGLGDRLWIGTGTDGLWLARDRHATRFDHRVLGQRGITALVARGDRLDVGVDATGFWRITGSGRVLRIDRRSIGCFSARGAPLPPGPACHRGDRGDVPFHVTAMTEHRGRLVVASFDRGLFERRGDHFVALDSPRFVNAIVSAGADLYVGAADGLYRRRGDRIERIRLGLPSEHVNALARGPDGTLWIATSDGLASFDGRRVRLLGTADGLPSRLVYAVTVTRDGAVWAGTATGAVRFAGDTTTVFSHARGTLPHDWVTALLPDGDAVLAGTYDAGVARLTGSGASEALEPFASAWINPGGLTRVGSTLAAATLGDGLLLVDDGKRRPSPRLPSDDVTAILRVDDSLWIGTRGGLARLAAP